MSELKPKAANPKPPNLGQARPRSPAEALEPSRAPQRPKGTRVRRERRRLGALVRVVSGVLTTLLIMTLGFGAAIGLGAYHYTLPGPLEVSRSITIAKGEGRIEIAELLEREGVIANRWVFVASHLYQSTLGGRRNFDLKAGEYEFRKHASMSQVLETLATGRSVLAKLTIPEGLTSQQIVERLSASPDLSGEITAIPAEGTLLADTYRFSRGMARAELIERMQAEQQRVLAQLWEKRQQGLPISSPEQAVILASVVEKETGRADERARVAAVFVNRLRKGMRLQSDPTIIYGIAGGAGSLGRAITRSDIDTRTAYNTYQIDGLPPGPICNPGRPALEATLNPARTAELFFVADGTGGHVFTQTLKDHNAAVANWRKYERELRARQETQAAAAGSMKPGASESAPAQEAPAVVLQAVPAASALVPAAAAAAAAAAIVPMPSRKPKQPPR